MPRKKENISQSAYKVPPHNLEAEQVILGSILINNDALNQIVDLLTSDDFYRKAHSIIFEGMLTLYNRDEPVDIITLTHILEEGGKLDKIGGSDYLASLADATSTSAGITYHSEIVRDLSTKRKLIEQCSHVSDNCFQSTMETPEILDFAEQSIFEIAERNAGQNFSPLREVVKESFGKVESMAHGSGNITGISTGFTDLDNLTSGLQPSDLVIIAGRPSMGKTALALNIVYNAAINNNVGTALFSLEMSSMQLGIRLLGLDGMIDASRLRKGALQDDEWTRLIESTDRLSKLPIFIDDSSGLSALEMKAKARRLKKKHDISLVVIDYLQLMQSKRSV